VSLELDALLSEPVASAEARAATAFADYAGDRAIVVFGTDDLARRVAAEATRAGRRVLAFADGQTAAIDGVPVLPITEAVARHGEDAVFVLCPTDGRRAGTCASLGAKRITPFALFAWSHPERLLPEGMIDLPQHVLEQRDEVLRAFALLEDEASRDAFVAQIRYRLHLDWACLEEPLTAPPPDVVVEPVDAHQADLWRVPLRLARPCRLYHQADRLVVATRPPGA